MILIDAIYIHNGGGKVLLDYLIDNLEKTNQEVFYLLDKRLEDLSITVKSSNKIFFLNSSLSERTKFYKENSLNFKKIFILGNIPPPIKTKAKTYTYFHSSLYLSVPETFSLFLKCKFLLKVLIINKWKKNSDVWLVQSKNMKDSFIEKFKIHTDCEIIPFYPAPEVTYDSNEKESNTFFYPSNAQENKNHINLIDAFCNFYDLYKTGKLILTVSAFFPKIQSYIEEKQYKGYPIINLGFVGKEKLNEYYNLCEYVIFPSFTESFGLGIIEGIMAGCKIIGADREYTYAVCKPSLVFDPMSSKSIFEALEKSFLKDISPSQIKVRDEIDNLIKLIGEDQYLNTN